MASAIRHDNSLLNAITAAQNEREYLERCLNNARAAKMQTQRVMEDTKAKFRHTEEVNLPPLRETLKVAQHKYRESQKDMDDVTTDVCSSKENSGARKALLDGMEEKRMSAIVACENELNAIKEIIKKAKQQFSDKALQVELYRLGLKTANAKREIKFLEEVSAQNDGHLQAGNIITSIDSALELIAEKSQADSCLLEELRNNTGMRQLSI